MDSPTVAAATEGGSPFFKLYEIYLVRRVGVGGWGGDTTGSQARGQGTKNKRVRGSMLVVVDVFTRYCCEKSYSERREGRKNETVKIEKCSFAHGELIAIFDRSAVVHFLF